MLYRVSRLRLCMRNEEFRPTEQKGMVRATDELPTTVVDGCSVHRQCERNYYYATFLHVYANIC